MITLNRSMVRGEEWDWARLRGADCIDGGTIIAYINKVSLLDQVCEDMPTVTVTIPCFNSADTLPLALSSMLAQTHEDWRCIIVDDGSTDRPERLVDIVNDKRITLIRFPENRGRGAARQAALEAADGDYLAMVDADDWIYPDKLRSQVEFLEANQSLDIVSGGMAITDERGDLVGVRGTGRFDGTPDIRGPHQGLATLPMAHAPSMIRMHVAKGGAYDPRLRRSQDADFMLQIVQGRYFAVMPEVVYSYTEIVSMSRRKLIESNRYDAMRLWKYRRSQPLEVVRGLTRGVLRTAYHAAAVATGTHETLVRRRASSASPEQASRFEMARARVQFCLEQHF